jgi:hypothetical protein
MPEEEKTDGHHDTATDQKDATDPTKGLLRWSLIVGAIGLLVLIVVSVYHPHLTERVKFLVGSSLSLFVLLAVIVQAVIYRGQWKAMQEQRTVMGDQLKTMRDSLTQNQQAMEKSWLFASAQGIATCEQLIAMREQTWAMRGQLAAIQKQAAIMSDGLTETRNVVAQNERVIEVAEENTRVFEQKTIDTNRAYVTASIETIEEGFQFHLGIDNSGNTPANDVRVFYGFGFREKPPFEKTEDGRLTVDGNYARDEGLGVIAPKSSLTLRTPKCGQMSGPDFQRWKLSQIRFYCWGMISYRDFFYQKRLSWFCFYQGQTAPKGAPYEHGNQAT